MAWSKTNLARSYACNTGLLRFYRTRKNWTQKHLAQRVGYSERLIRKAEGGQNVSVDTIDELATALSGGDTIIYPEDLITCQESMARRFSAAWYSRHSDIAEVIKDFVHDDTVFQILGDQRRLPFVGRYRGLGEFASAAKQFFRAVEVTSGHECKSRYKHVVRGLEVAVWGTSWIHQTGAPLSQPIPMTQRLRFERGKLHTFVDYCSQRLATPSIHSAEVTPNIDSIIQQPNHENELTPQPN